MQLENYEKQGRIVSTIYLDQMCLDIYPGEMPKKGNWDQIPESSLESMPKRFS